MANSQPTTMANSQPTTMADSKQIQAIQTQQETTPINNSSRKRKLSSPATTSPPIPSSPTTAAEEIRTVPTVDKRKKYRCVDRGYEPGFRFIPKDEELIQDYLMKKLEGKPIRLEEMHEVDLYQCNPEDLADNFPHLGEFEWYFFTPRERKYRNGVRPKRSAGNGYWKATGADKKITIDTDTPNERVIGFRKALVFYQGNPPSGKKTNWIMHEFRPHAPPRVRENLDDMRLDDFVLCKIYEKPERPERQEKKCLKDETSDEYEDQDIDVPTSTSTPEMCDNDDALGTARPGHSTDYAAPNNNPNGDATDFINPSEGSMMPWALEEPPSLFYDEGMNTELVPFPYSSCYDHLQLFSHYDPARSFQPYYPPGPAGDSHPLMFGHENKMNIDEWGVKRERRQF